MPNPLARLKFALVVRKQRTKLLGYAVKVCRNEIDAEDLVQESLSAGLQALERLRSLEEHVIVGYLLMTMKNNFTTKCRRQRRLVFDETPYLVEPELEQPEESMEEWRLLDDETLREVEQVLSEKERRVWALRREEKSYQQIAREFGIETGTVGKLLHDARRKLRAECRKRINRNPKN